MKTKMHRISWAALLIAALLGGDALGQNLGIDWWTVSGGGDMGSVGADFELSGTIGQPGTGGTLTMTGGTLSLSGGFWPGAAAAMFTMGDMNCDGQVSPADIDPFVIALVDPDGYAVQFPDCRLLNADLNHDGTVSAADIDPFVILLTGGG
jgi:hypothetical protein